jgi:hypothetical protein
MDKLTTPSPQFKDSQPVAVAQRAPVLLFTITVAILITNLFGPQTLVVLMASPFGLSTAASGTMAIDLNDWLLGWPGNPLEQVTDFSW